MKKILALSLFILLIIGLVACGGETEPETSTSAPTEATEVPTSEFVETPADIETAPTEEVHDHLHINYKGLEKKSSTLEDVAQVEGREPDFDFASGDSTIYAYNNVTADGLDFTQVQFTFGADKVRISCTISGENTEESMTLCKDAMTALYGDPTESSGIFTWRDHTDNYITLMTLNETTVQLAYYLCAE